MLDQSDPYHLPCLDFDNDIYHHCYLGSYCCLRMIMMDGGRPRVSIFHKGVDKKNKKFILLTGIVYTLLYFL